MKYQKINYLFKLVETESIEVDLPGIEILTPFIRIKDNVLTTYLTYAWNGSSVPFKKWYKWIWDADKHSKTPSLFHDALYQLMRLGLLSKHHKDFADLLYKNLCIKKGMSKWLANTQYKVLVKLGHRAINNKTINQVFED